MTGCHREPSGFCVPLPQLLGKDYTPEKGEECEKFARHRHPPKVILDHIDAALSQNACVGNLAKWDRLYSFNHKRGDPEVDESVIHFQFREAGRYDFKAGRRTTMPLEWLNLDDRQYDLVSGHLDVPSRNLVIEYCGPNVGG
jgi:hypothetical protein